MIASFENFHVNVNGGRYQFQWNKMETEILNIKIKDRRASFLENFSANLEKYLNLLPILPRL